MDQVRLGVIGCGMMAHAHIKYFPDIPRLKFTAAADPKQHVVDKLAEDHGVTPYTSGEELLASGEVDAVLIATPHYHHPVFGISALRKGIHVLSEKPIAVTAKAAAEMNAVAAEHSDLIYAAMFQQRTIGNYQVVKKLIDDGELGEIQRVQWTITDWFRTQAYYNSGSWRATWAGEGGGVLLNQCPHNLDMLIHLTGRPSNVHAHVALGKYHDIEVEDEVTAYLEYPNGATGVFITTTGEAPGSNHLEIAGDRGRITVAEGKVAFKQTEVSVREFLRNSEELFTSPPSETRDLTAEKKGGAHKQITENFIEAILDGTPLIAPADEGLHSVELANAMLMSGLTGQSVPMPMDRDAFDEMLKDLIRKSPKSVPSYAT